MNCPECNGEYINIKVLTETKLYEEKMHGLLWKLLFVFWVLVLLFISWRDVFLFAPAVLFIVSGNKKQSISQKHNAVGVCQECGHVWYIMD